MADDLHTIIIGNTCRSPLFFLEMIEVSVLFCKKITVIDAELLKLLSAGWQTVGGQLRWEEERS